MYNNNYNYTRNWYQPPGPQPGKHEATVAMVLGIVSCALLIFGYTALGSIVTGIIGLIYASRAKSLGFNGTPRTVGYVCSLIGLILGVLVCLLLVWLGAWSIGMVITLALTKRGSAKVCAVLLLCAAVCAAGYTVSPIHRNQQAVAANAVRKQENIDRLVAQGEAEFGAQGSA